MPIIRPRWRRLAPTAVSTNRLLYTSSRVENRRSVTNEKAFEGGRNTETPAEFRERYYKSVDFAGGVKNTFTHMPTGVGRLKWTS